ncbi:hypothetical protein, partial [Gemmiger qucibialis]|uniref:hypothetical protein n=1 Tax=Gemmiger qucibialis TaxID=2997294 RepID=UPI0022E29FCF
GQKPLALCDRCPCFGSLFPPLAALTFAASSIICAFGLASAAPRSPYRHLELCGIALKRIGKPHKNPQKQNAENIPSPCWGTRYLLHIYHQSNIKLSSAIRCSMHQDVGRFCAAGPASCRSIDIIIV